MRGGLQRPIGGGSPTLPRRYGGSPGTVPPTRPTPQPAPSGGRQPVSPRPGIGTTRPGGAPGGLPDPSTLPPRPPFENMDLTDPLTGERYDRPNCSNTYPRYASCEINYDVSMSHGAALDAIGYDSRKHKQSNAGTDRGSHCYGGLHETYVCKNNENNRIGSIASCPCCYEGGHGLPILKTNAHSVWKTF